MKQQPDPRKFNELEDYLYACGHWKHWPGEPYPRIDMPAESIYAQEWQKLMLTATRYREEPNAQLAAILSNMPRWPRARDATICASVVCFLGTNCGHSIIHVAKDLKKRANDRHAMLRAWASDNMRMRCVNGGIRTIESIMARPEHLGRTQFGIGVVKRPRLSADTLEVVEHLMEWLGDHEGWAFIEQTERLIEERRKLDFKTKLAMHQAMYEPKAIDYNKSG